MSVGVLAVPKLSSLTKLLKFIVTADVPSDVFVESLLLRAASALYLRMQHNALLLGRPKSLRNLAGDLLAISSKDFCH